MLFQIPSTATSWVPLDPMRGFPIQNLPYVRFDLDPEDDESMPRVGARIGDRVLALGHEAVTSRLGDEARLAVECLETGLPIDPEQRAALRSELFELLRSGGPGEAHRAELQDALAPQEALQLLTFWKPGAFVDFYSGIHHATNVGKLFRPDQPPLLPNYRHLPVGYNGRASTVFPSGLIVDRPRGIVQPAGGPPEYVPTRELDFELEIGFFIWNGFNEGPVTPAEFADYCLGFVLVNDWSARDVQRFEYQPLGPFLAKSFCTTVSQGVVPVEALEPFRVQGPVQDPAPLPHLADPGPSHYDVTLDAYLMTDRMTRPQRITRTNARHLYWSFGQMLAHQSSNGTMLEAADLYASGTISGPDTGSFGSMLELTWRGTQPLVMEETGEERLWLEDGDTLALVGWAGGDGYRISFGECVGVVGPAR
jgi:fumarylacetoacetase